MTTVNFYGIPFSANNFAMQAKRKTISGSDVLNAMTEMEFERFVEPLKNNLEGKISPSNLSPKTQRYNRPQDVSARLKKDVTKHIIRQRYSYIDFPPI